MLSPHVATLQVEQSLYASQHISLTGRALAALGSLGEINLTTIEILVLQESTEQLNGVEGLVLGDSVASTLHGGVGVLLVLLDVSCSSSIHEPGGPRLGSSTIQLGEALLGLSERNGSNIDVSAVHKDGNIRSLVDNLLVEGDHGCSADIVLEEVLAHTDGPLATRRSHGVESLLNILAVQVISGELVQSL
tara:strand:- start:1971 stop:2543 length:573 start_codon:yes stop_codon:yes gene_type:complete